MENETKISILDKIIKTWFSVSLIVAFFIVGFSFCCAVAPKTPDKIEASAAAIPNDGVGSSFYWSGTLSSFVAEDRRFQTAYSSLVPMYCGLKVDSQYYYIGTPSGTSNISLNWRAGDIYSFNYSDYDLNISVIQSNSLFHMQNIGLNNFYDPFVDTNYYGVVTFITDSYVSDVNFSTPIRATQYIVPVGSDNIYTRTMISDSIFLDDFTAYNIVALEFTRNDNGVAHYYLITPTLYHGNSIVTLPLQLSVTSSGGGSITQGDLDNAYNNGYTAGQSVGYENGYTEGVTFADGRVNTSSQSYGTGYANGYQVATQNSQDFIDRAYDDGYNAGYSDGLSAGGTGSAEDVQTAYDTGYNAGVSFADGRLNEHSKSYEVGFGAGQLLGDTQGYQRGYSDGSRDGYQSGFNAGIADGGDYSFNALFYAIFDAPLKVIQEGLQFEIFGVNVATLVLSLITLAFIVFVLRFFLR